MPFCYLEDIATADIAFEATGKDLQEVFISAAEATMNVMIEDLRSIQPLQSLDLQLQNKALDLLLFHFLQELIYHKDHQQLLLRVQQLEISQEEDQFHLRAGAGGERLDPSRHEQRVDVKAVTLHRFSLEKTDQGWKALVILDI